MRFFTLGGNSSSCCRGSAMTLLSWKKSYIVLFPFVVLDGFDSGSTDTDSFFGVFSRRDFFWVVYFDVGLASSFLGWTDRKSVV